MLETDSEKSCSSAFLARSREGRFDYQNLGQGFATGQINLGVTFYKPVGIPDGFFSLGHYCQPNDQALRGYVLVAQDAAASRLKVGSVHDSPLAGYKAMGFVVTDNPNQPALEEVRCVRTDLTETCETYNMILNTGSNFSNTHPSPDEEPNIACLKNLDSTLHAMPNLKQIHALIKHYGATVFFHPDDIYMPSSVPWFFKNGALVYQNGKLEGKPIDSRGSNLPSGGKNDGEFWIDLPDDDDERTYLKSGNIESAELYVHVKPALGGLLLTLRCQHVGDWEHFTLRLSNFTGELWSVYFSQHSGGEWVDAPNLEFIEGNKPVVYSSKGGHASFPHPGIYVQGSSKLGIGVRNDAARSKFFIDSSTNYQIVAAEYLGDTAVVEPNWLQYMREWGPTIVYDSRAELEKIISLLPVFFRFSVENIFDLFQQSYMGRKGQLDQRRRIIGWKMKDAS
ncbi:hypothetical protein CK203_098709 [Vitis vinifera]|uniref:Vacuolar protein sorting-associated protein 62 n=1 Tax=Vitis vinifera TaxID=29760 RepID=A0A438D6C0_VITVI|nr:hypothetical protein CK203_098709 [Vitis vinifera]